VAPGGRTVKVSTRRDRLVSDDILVSSLELVGVVEQVADAAGFVSELRRIVAAEYRAWSQIVRDNVDDAGPPSSSDVDDAGPPSSAVEQLDVLTGLCGLECWLLCEMMI